jgi:hypothetical protein
MEEKIGRETLQKLLELQIELLKKYTELLESPQRRQAKEAINEILKAIITKAVPPVLAFGKLAYDNTVALHEEAVKKTGDLLADLLKEEKARANVRETMQAEARRRAGSPKA